MMWASVMGDNPSQFKGMKQPVEQVSWNDCQEYIKKLNDLLTYAGAAWAAVLLVQRTFYALFVQRLCF